MSSNLQSFLRLTTPSIMIERAIDDSLEFFTLEQLWEVYDEWSAYGVGIPISLDDDQTIVQYYAPSLSGMQLYLAKDNVLRTSGEDSEFETDSTLSSSDRSNKIWDSDSGSDQETDFKIKERFGRLYFQFFEAASPHQRLPLRDTIDKLSLDYPGLRALRSNDLSPASWIAIAWYPIYHLPVHRNPKEFYCAFLTYHTLSSTLQEEGSLVNAQEESQRHDVDCDMRKVKDERKSTRTFSLPPFGLAAYKMQTPIWIGPKIEDYRPLTSLWSAAASWLRQLEAHHPDFDFFSSRTA
ncbi:uncharacterized protein LOC144699927 [Wolffia australiana]